MYCMNYHLSQTKIVWLIGLLIHFSAFSYASGFQNQDSRTVTGTVIDEIGEPVIGASVVLMGTTVGIITDINGHYSIQVPDAKAVLQFSYLGYVSQNVTVGNRERVDAQLIEDRLNLEEVVVVGYGVQKKSHLTGSVSKLKGDGLADLPVTSVDQALQGRLAGVSIQNTTSETGVEASIRVRGMGSLSTGGEPLVVVDGYPVADGLSFVEAADIESIEVLKDAASAAIYGSRGSNGVIMITTKTGAIAKPKYTFNMYHGFKKAYKLHDNMNYDDYIGLLFREASLREQDPSVAENKWNLVTNTERAEYIINTQIYTETILIGKKKPFAIMRI